MRPIKTRNRKFVFQSSMAQRAIPVSAIWDETQRHGERLRRYVAQHQEQVGMERVVLPPGGPTINGLWGQPGWRQNEHPWRRLEGVQSRSGFDVVATPERDHDTGEWVEAVHGVNMTYIWLERNRRRAGV